MPSYQVKVETVTVGGFDYLIRSLLDIQQYSDPHGEAEQAGISSATWPLFGQLWPSARVLALEMHSFDLKGKRILEIGAGLGLASLVIHRRKGDITVSDWHPLTQAFMNENCLLNKMVPLKYQTGDWSADNPHMGEFDLIIGSDVLYERQQPGQLASFIDCHANDSSQIIIVDPDRGNRVAFCREMSKRGFGFTSRRAKCHIENGEPYKGRFLTFSRSMYQEALS